MLSLSRLIKIDKLRDREIPAATGTSDSFPEKRMSTVTGLIGIGDIPNGNSADT